MFFGARLCAAIYIFKIAESSQPVIYNLTWLLRMSAENFCPMERREIPQIMQSQLPGTYTRTAYEMFWTGWIITGLYTFKQKPSSAGTGWYCHPGYPH